MNTGLTGIFIAAILVVIGGTLVWQYFGGQELSDSSKQTFKQEEEQKTQSEEEMRETITEQSDSSPQVEGERGTSGTCTAISYTGSPEGKINLYFYENGFNSNIQEYNEFVSENTAIVFGGPFQGKTYPGVEPFKSLRQEFNVFSYQNQNEDCDSSSHCSLRQQVWPDLESCQGGFAGGNFGTDEGNYNVIIFPTPQGQSTTSDSLNRLNPTVLRVSSADTISINVNSFNDSSLPHELGHRIGFFDEEYAFFDLHLGAKTYKPNVDSFNCTKWCQGVNVQSACYEKYTSWLDCFNDRIMQKSNEAQKVLQEGGIGYNTDNYDWWGACFETRNIEVCGAKLFELITPSIGEFGEEWVSDWEYCKAEYQKAPGQDSCDLGLSCSPQGAGCYVGASFSRFLPSQENQFIMGRDTRTNHRFNAYDEEILRHNIINKVRYLDVEVLESQG